MRRTLRYIRARQISAPQYAAEMLWLKCYIWSTRIRGRFWRTMIFLGLWAVPEGEYVWNGRWTLRKVR